MPPSSPPRPSEPDEREIGSYNGVFALLVINIAVFVADDVAKLGFVRQLYLNHADPSWYQYLTATFCHASWEHLSGNLFFVYVFGRLVSEHEGPAGVILTYVVTGVGANLVDHLVSPASYSLGASGAVFGLFAVSILVRFRLHWKRLLEVVILGQFVLTQTWYEAKQLGADDGIGHFTHLAGALCGVAFVALAWKVAGGSDGGDGETDPAAATASTLDP